MRSQARSKRVTTATKSKATALKLKAASLKSKPKKSRAKAIQTKTITKAVKKSALKKGGKTSKKKITTTTVSKKIKQEILEEEEGEGEIPVALQNVKTEVKVENQEFLPSQTNGSAVVQDGRSQTNLIGANNRPFRIPPHLLGRNLSDPASDAVAGSRRPLQKPRMGVKIPYRNLTSQIVTHEELTRELLERSNRNNPVCGNNSGPVEGSKGYIFTMKLMARLAHRMPNCSLSELAKFGSPFGFVPRPPLDPETEREIALKQLRELPSKRRTRDMVTEDVDYKRVAIKAKPLTPQQLALKQLKEIQIRKPRVQTVKKQPNNVKIKIEPSATSTLKRKSDPIKPEMLPAGPSKLLQGVIIQRKSSRMRKPNKRY